MLLMEKSEALKQFQLDSYNIVENQIESNQDIQINNKN